jgi:DNA-binding NarL/FixJ family response regulator
MRNDKISTTLTPNEEQVEILLCCGYRQNQIAGIIKVTHHTIKKHQAQVYSKRGVGSQTLLLLDYLKRKGVDLAALGLDK